MAVRPSDLHAIPLFEKITEDHLNELTEAFERQEVPSGQVLFEAGSAPTHFFLLVTGEVALLEAGETRFRLNPLSAIGELGALTGTLRMTTAVTTQPSEIWRIGVRELEDFFEAHGDVAYPFHHNLLNVVAGKLRRDARRLDEVRSNLIRTQKAMKRLLDLVLDSEETPLSKVIVATLEELIEKNRRLHYPVEPAYTLKSSVRLDNGELIPVVELSDGWLRLGRLPGTTGKGAHWSGVLVLPAREIPISGTIDSIGENGALVKLDLLIEEYSAALGDYLTRLQMLDFVV